MVNVATMAFELLSKWVVLLIFILLAAWLFTIWNSKSIIPHGVPVVGRLTKVTDRNDHHGKNNVVRNTMEQGYYKYSKNGVSFSLPNWLHGPDLIVPPSQIRWIMEQPNSILSLRENFRAIFAMDYTLPFIKNPSHEDLIRRDLTKQLPALTPVIIDEVGLAFDKLWGTNQGQYKDVCVFETMVKIVARASNRVFVGLPLCQNEDYLNNVAKFAQDTAMGGALINVLPRLLRPIFGPLITIPNRYHYRGCARHTIPLIQQRLTDMSRKAAEPDSKFKAPNDFITWAIEDSLNGSDPRERTPEGISYRLIDINFPAIHTSSFTMTNALFDLASSPPEKGFLAGLREEVERIQHEEQGSWTKAGVAKMVRVDSAIRESMRYSGIFSRGVIRRVIAPDGITLQDGIHLPPGAKVGVAAYSVHHDEAAYENPYDYDAFRFSRPREERAGAYDGEMEKERVLHQTKDVSLTSTTETWLAFGHGRLACPGRYFAAAEMKLMLAYAVLHYDIEPVVGGGKRPPNRWVLDTILPPMKAGVRVRRRRVLGG